MFSSDSKDSSWFGSTEPIKYETTQLLPYDQMDFYEVIKDVNSYSKFVPFMT